MENRSLSMIIQTMPTIKLFANLRKIAGQKEISIIATSEGLPSVSRGATLYSVLNDLVRQIPALDGVILENGQIRPQLIITLNGLNATDLHVIVAEEDIIAIFPPISGG